MESKKIKAGIVGGAGYTGGEMIRLLLNHPNVELVFVHSRSNAGQPIVSVHKDLIGETSLLFTDTIDKCIDVLMLCVGHGEATAFLKEHKIDEHIVVIDLSQDFRLKSADMCCRDFVYGLPEAYKSGIASAKSIANPGCFATAIQLALLPLASSNKLTDVHITGITGSTGAGQKLQQSSHFSWRENNIQAYKTLCHQHEAEVLQTLSDLQVGFSELSFVPWRGDFTRGIYLTAYCKTELSEDELKQLYKSYYQQAAFTHVSDTMIDLKQVVNTNKCVLHVEKVAGKAVVHAAIDNLLKGASGQAVQNMNLIFGFNEDAGLKLKPASF
ncbi:MAG: N-acetyl-gamma-glutamyl-phosphate reductase [Chitinophagales bacterium]|nr:N-acetyl-gamma-glutamyl-phosphate reductase [Chitinophagales bacterium]